MNYLLALLAVQAAAPAAAPPTPPPPTAATVPTDWAPLAPLPWKAPPQLSRDLIAFVGGEVKAGRCGAARAVGDTLTVAVDMAVQLRADGSVARVVPHAIDCVTVEQFAAGLVTTFARGGLRPTTAEGWYRTGFTFTWPR